MITEDGENPRVGNRVTVTAWVAEYYSVTELVHPRNTKVGIIILQSVLRVGRDKLMTSA